MGRTLRLGLSVAVLIAVVAPAARAAEEPRLDGMYLSKGLNPDGTEYRGVVDVAQQGDSFVVTWMMPSTEGDTILLVPTAVGIGVLDGGMFAVSYYGSKMAGVVLYRVEGDGRRLAGRWVVAGGDGGVYSETLTKATTQVSEPEASEPSEPSEDAKPRAPHVPNRPSAGRAI